jgi:Baseplate J-like protein
MGVQNQANPPGSGYGSGGGCGCGCGCSGSSASICPCEDQGGCAWPIDNLPGLSAIGYRVGDFGSFRRAMLLPSPLDPAGESYLEGWRPTAGSDLALQVVDWWAYVADVLTFYNERIANEQYLGTAVLPSSVSRLVSLLGYRPRPGIGATATLGVLAAGPGSVTLPAGFQVASKSAPGVASQTFELAQAVAFAAPTSVPTPPDESLPPVVDPSAPPPGSPAGTATPPPQIELIVRGGVLVKGKPTSFAVGDRLLLMAQDPTKWIDYPPGIVTVTGMAQETDSYGKTNTRVLLDGTDDFDPRSQAADYQLCRPTIANHLVSVPSGAAPITDAYFTLDSTARSINAGDPLVIDTPGAADGVAGGSGFDIGQVTAYSETLWYANGSSSSPTTSPGANGIPLIVAQVRVTPSETVDFETKYGTSTVAPTVVIRTGWKSVGTLLPSPVNQVAGLPSSVALNQAPAAKVGTATPALVEDANGNGAQVTATPQSANQVDLSTGAAGSDGLPSTLQPPLRLLWDLITVSRGATVADELLGTGDATRPGQDFTLHKSPVTYLADTSTGAAPAGTGGPAGLGSRSGPGYSSTVQLAVDGVYWSEVPMFYGHGPAETVFVTREDETGATHVLTGDGLNGARLRTGAQVSATYRVGAGAAVPPAGTLTQILSPQTNLSALRNPAAAGGGADPDSPADLDALAPASVLTFDRAISGEDYAVVAAQAPGVARAGAVWAWDAGEQRAMTVVYVGDDEGAVASARAALRAEADPNRPIIVRRARPRPIKLRMTLEVSPKYVLDDVVTAARNALVGATGLFAPGVLAIGETLYRSRIESVSMLPGVVAIHRLRLEPELEYAALYEKVLWDSRGPRFVPGDGGYFQLASGHLTVNAEVSTSE